MSLILVSVTSFLGAILGKRLFKNWMNHLSLYCIIMGAIIFFYELKLLPYVDLIPLAWFFIISSFVSFLFGILTVISARQLQSTNEIISEKINLELPIFSDSGKTIKYAILLLGLISIFSGLQHWAVLISKFGSIPAVLINANTIYRLNVNREIEGFIPYLPIVGYVAIFFAGIYAAYKGKFTFLTFLPFIGIILKELATVGRAGMLLALMEFIFTFSLFRNLLKKDANNSFKFSKKNAVVAFLILFIFIIASASFVKLFRGSAEYYSGASKELREFRHNLILSPSIYLYLSSEVGVLSQYVKDNNEELKFGQNTFLPIYDILAKLGAFKRVNDVQRGYFIPMWTNTGTYIRELHSDFGSAGIYLGPYILGLLITWLWFKFYREKSLIVFVFLVYMYLVVGFSFLEMVTRISYWFVSLFAIVLLIPFLEKIAILKGGKNIVRQPIDF